MNLKDYRNAIKSIAQDGKTLVAFQDVDNSYLFFIAYKFESSSSNPATMLNYNMLEGKDVTDIMTNLTVNLDRKALLKSLENRLSQEPVQHIEFSNDVRWYKFGKTAAGNMM